MRFKPQFGKRSDGLKLKIRHRLRKHPYIFPILGLIFGFVVVLVFVIFSGGKTLSSSDSHVVKLFDNGTEQTLDTKASTVGELIDKLPLHLIPQDVIEPGRDTQIVEDNFRINVYRARPVVIVDGGRTLDSSLSAEKSPRVVVQHAHLKLYPEDLATFAEGDIKKGILGERVVISRAVPIKLDIYGSAVSTRTQGKTVVEVLNEKQIKLAEGDSVHPGPSTPITPNLQIFILRKGAQIINVTETIPAPQQVVLDNSLTFGTTVVRQNGTDGKKVVTYEIIKVKGKEVKRRVIQQTVILAPVPTIVARGQNIDIPNDKIGVLAAAGIASSDFGYANFIISHESNWRPNAYNGSGAYGLCQALPGSKMASAGSDWQTNPVTQARWCSGYAHGNYGGWSNAYNHWLAYRSW